MKRKLLIGLAVAAVFALALSFAGCAKPAQTMSLPEAESGEHTHMTRTSGSFQDKTITCKDCGEGFLFSADEQAFYAERGFQSEPLRCRACRER